MLKSQHILRYIIQDLIIAMTALISACSNSNITENIYPEAHIIVTEIESPSSLPVSKDEIVRNSDIKSRILDQYSNWKGVRYRLGGSTKKGIDCSSFVQRTFREQFGLNLPRSTYEQQKTGKFVSRSKLRTGDLVLFRVGSTGRHVGIYIGNDQFIHASASSGVTISNMNAPYWKKRYKKARRVLTFS